MFPRSLIKSAKIELGLFDSYSDLSPPLKKFWAYRREVQQKYSFKKGMACVRAKLFFPQSLICIRSRSVHTCTWPSRDRRYTNTRPAWRDNSATESQINFRKTDLKIINYRRQDALQHNKVQFLFRLLYLKPNFFSFTQLVLQNPDQFVTSLLTKMSVTASSNYPTPFPVLKN